MCMCEMYLLEEFYFSYSELHYDFYEYNVNQTSIETTLETVCVGFSSPIDQRCCYFHSLRATRGVA